MGILDQLLAELEAYVAGAKLPDADTRNLRAAITKLRSANASLNKAVRKIVSIEPEGNFTMTNPTSGYVQILQADLDGFASDIGTIATGIDASASNIGGAVTVLSAYIATLLAGQGTPLPAADESAVHAAVGALQTEVAVLQEATTALDALEPPAPVNP
jgi:hypothetical protein